MRYYGASLPERDPGYWRLLSLPPAADLPLIATRRAGPLAQQDPLQLEQRPLHLQPAAETA
jgi:hypothetical protein